MVIGTIVLLAIGAGLSWIWPPLGLITLPVIIWLFSFFRDPKRDVPSDPDIMVSPADGMVSDIIELDHFELLGGPCVRVGIFLSVFNVHINRAPCAGKVSNLIYKEGKFLNALNHGGASSQNESNTIVLSQLNTDKPMAVVKQIVGLIARRIVCTGQIGQVLARGEHIGMIKFGSRTELYIPKWLEPKIEVVVGQKVRGAADIIARLGAGSSA